LGNQGDAHRSWRGYATIGGSETRESVGEKGVLREGLPSDGTGDEKVI